MDFLNLIWLIPLFPLVGAALMLLVGKKLDPQPPSEVAVVPGVEPVYEHGHGGHDSAHAHQHVHDSHGGHHAHSPLKTLINFICPGLVLLSFLFSVGAVWQLAQQSERVHQ